MGWIVLQSNNLKLLMYLHISKICIYSNQKKINIFLCWENLAGLLPRFGCIINHDITGVYSNRRERRHIKVKFKQYIHMPLTFKNIKWSNMNSFKSLPSITEPTSQVYPSPRLHTLYSWHHSALLVRGNMKISCYYKVSLLIFNRELQLRRDTEVFTLRL